MPEDQGKLDFLCHDLYLCLCANRINSYSLVSCELRGPFFVNRVLNPHKLITKSMITRV